jgi:hypothetical protein
MFDQSDSIEDACDGLLSYVKTMMFEIGEMDWHQTAIDTVVAALAAMKEARMAA